MRVYIPVTSTQLRTLLDAGRFVAPLTAFAVTAGLREWYVDDDLEELEYAALIEAARASLRLLDADTAAAPRRAVVAVDVSDAQVSVRDDIDRGVVHLSVDVPLSSIASLHIDDADAEPTVSAAAAAIVDADLGDEQSQELVDDAEGYELSWYASQEIAGLLDVL